ncbi:hypothetical protein QYE76_039975 [Lolium multiflorum]|uniref:Retrotransposon protein, putative, unclassified n=1 Tax=Lolium multiflorum TaxID=4521 RepID=A0AAD8WSA6_LOLMU|nr:hypothetical protein QYE76_039975 [Lolium multiflorum]
MIALLKEYPDCFAWDYTEMPGLDRSIIEHRLPLKKGFRPFQQRARQMKAEILEEVKKEIEKMLNAGFIRPCRYAEWISSIVPVEKKDGRWRVAIDFRDLNRATPKDEYPMPVAETLINAAAGHKNDLTTEEYAALMSDSVEDVTELRLWSLEKIKENKAKVARAYNKKVRPKEFHVGDLVWEAVLPLGTKDAAYGKWSPNWHGPYKVDQVLKGNAYMLEELDGVKFPVAVNGQHLKKYFPSMWDDGQ